jgi:hypothetical protein
MAKPITAAVSRRALLLRINRALRTKRQQVRADRYGGETRHLLLDMKDQTIVATDIDLEQLGRKLDVLRPWERAIGGPNMSAPNRRSGSRRPGARSTQRRWTGAHDPTSP